MYTQGQIQSLGMSKGYIPKDKVKLGEKQSVMYPRTNSKGKEQWLYTQGQSQSWEKNSGYKSKDKVEERKGTVVITQEQIHSLGTKTGYIPMDSQSMGKTVVIYPRTNSKGKEYWLYTLGQRQSMEREKHYKPKDKVKAG